MLRLVDELLLCSLMYRACICICICIQGQQVSTGFIF